MSNTIAFCTISFCIIPSVVSVLVGATLADWQRKREEEAKRVQRQPSPYRQIVMAYQKVVDNAKAALATSRGMDAKISRMEDAEGAAIAAVAQEKKEARKAEEKQVKAEELQAGLSAYYEGRKAGEVESAPKVEEKSWWGSLVDAGNGLWNAGTSALAGLMSTEKETGDGGKALYMPALADDPPWWKQLWNRTTAAISYTVNVAKDVLFSSEDEPPTLADRLWEGSDWNVARKSVINNLGSQQQALITESGNNPLDDYYYYDAKTLGLAKWQSPMSISQFQKLDTHINTGELSWGDTLPQIETMQLYLGQDNQGMISVLRELYYATALNTFIKDAKSTTSSAYAVLGDQKGVTSGNASFARALLLLTTQGHGYTPPVVKIQHPDGYNSVIGEFAFDHVVAALDGNFHDLSGSIDLGYAGEKFASLPTIQLNSKEIITLPVITWQGDLVGSTMQAYKNQSATTGYRIEMPPEDFEGDMLGVVLAHNNAISANGNNLAGELSLALAADSPYVAQLYTKFAKVINIEYDPQTGMIDIQSKQEFLNNNLEIISDLGSGFYVKNTIDVTIAFPNNQITIHSYAADQTTNFLDQIEEGIKTEVGK